MPEYAKRVAADAIVFLMWPGWKTELRANRWHYASRWARHLPVILVQPVDGLPADVHLAEDEPRIPGCEILHVTSAQRDDVYLHRAIVQLEQLRRHVELRGYERLLFWMYNPDFVAMMSLMPAVGRIYHATENYFMHPGLKPWFLNRMRGAIGSVDTTICCSEGVRNSYEPHARGDCMVLTNGCDYSFYARGGSDDELREAGRDYAKIAVYGGNINDRLDYELLSHAADSATDTFFAFFGREYFPDAVFHNRWGALLCRPNVRYFGLVDPDRLPPIYGTADVGLMPYRADSFGTKNEFPIKTFEMLATGLPVVASNRDMLAPLERSGIKMAWSADEFAAAIGTSGRAALTDTETAELRELAADNDYDKKFEVVLKLVSRLTASREEPTTPTGSHMGFDSMEDLELVLRGVRRDRTVGELLWQLGLSLARVTGIALWPIIPSALRSRLKGIWQRLLGVS